MKNKTILIVLSLLLTARLVPAAMAEAETVNRNLLYAQEDTYIADIESYQGQLYILRSEGLFAYDAAAGEERLVTEAVTSDYERENNIDLLLAGEDGLYGLITGKRKLVRLLDDRGEYKGETVFTWEGEEDFISGAFLQEGRLYLKTHDTGGEALRGISLSGGEDSRTPLRDIRCLSSYQDGKILAVSRLREGSRLRHVLCLISLGDGETEELQALDFRPDALAWDARGDRILLAGEGRIYSRDTEGNAELSAYILSGDVSKLVSIGGGMAAVHVDNNVAVRAQGSAGEQTRLVLGRDYGRSADYISFLRDRPDVELIFRADPFMTPEEQFINDMTMRGGETDIYILSDPNLLPTIYEKGFGADLSGSAKLAAIASDMHMPFQKLFLREGALRAIPQEVYIDVLGYNPDLFERLELPVPTGYEQLMDLLEMWLADYADEHPQILFDPFDQGLDLPSLLERRADEQAAAGQEAVYSAPDMERLLSRYMELSAAYSDRRGKGETREWGFYAISLLYKGMYDYLPLSFEAGHNPVISGADVQMSYFVVNPFSPRQEEALQFIEYAADAWPQEIGFTLLRSMARPIQRQEYQREKQRLQDDLDAFEEARSKAETIDLPVWDLKIQRKREELALSEFNRWTVTQEQADRYLGLVDKIVISDRNPLSILRGRQPEFFDQAAAMEPAEFLRLLDERVRLVRLEGY